jgi:hypothetical protein
LRWPFDRIGPLAVPQLVAICGVAQSYSSAEK